MARIPLVGPDALTPEQRRVYDKVVAGPRGALRGPLRAALHRPELADRWHELGELLRYRTSLPPALSELAILVTAQRTASPLEWIFHEEAARTTDLDPAIIEDVRRGRRPRRAGEDELAIYDYCAELHDTRRVSDRAYARVLERWGIVGTVELTALVGYYTMVAMTLNAHEFPLPEGAAPPFEPLAEAEAQAAKGATAGR